MTRSQKHFITFEILQLFNRYYAQRKVKQVLYQMSRVETKSIGSLGTRNISNF